MTPHLCSPARAGLCRSHRRNVTAASMRLNWSLKWGIVAARLAATGMMHSEGSNETFASLPRPLMRCRRLMRLRLCPSVLAKSNCLGLSAYPTLSGCTGGLVVLLGELADQLLEDATHLGVRDRIGVQVDIRWECHTILARVIPWLSLISSIPRINNCGRALALPTFIASGRGWRLLAKAIQWWRLFKYAPNGA